MKNLSIKIGILSMCFLSMSALVITSALSAIVHSFPDESVAKIQMIATIPSFGTLITTVVVGFLAVRMSKKLLALIGVFLVRLGGVFTPIILKSLHITYGNMAFTVGVVASLVMAALCFATNIGRHVMAAQPQLKSQE